MRSLTIGFRLDADFRTVTNEDGLQMGRQVAKLVTRHYFKSVDDSDDDDDREDSGRGRHDD